MVKICEFYSGDGLPIGVDYDNRAVFLGDYVVEPLVKNGHITDLDHYFQAVLPGWEDR